MTIEMPKLEVIFVLFMIFQSNIAENVTNNGDDSESGSPKDNYIIVALDDWDLSDNEELQNLLMNLQSLGESQSEPKQGIKMEKHSKRLF